MAREKEPPAPPVGVLDSANVPFNVSEHYEVHEVIGEGAYGVVV